MTSRNRAGAATGATHEDERIAGVRGFDPLMECLQKTAQLLGHPASTNSLGAGLPLEHGRLTVRMFSRAAERAGLASRVMKLDLSRLGRLDLPAILLLADHAAVVAVHVDGDRETLDVLLPESGMGLETVSMRELAERYTGYAILVKPEYRPADAVSEELRADSPRWFGRTVLSSWRIYRDVIAASFMINLFGLATPFFILNVYDRVVPNLAYDTLWVLTSGVLVVFTFELLMRALRGHFIDAAGKKSGLRLSAMLFEKALGLKMAVRPKSVGAFARNLQEFDSVRDFLTSLSVSSLIDLPFTILALGAIWFIGGDMVWIPVVAVFVLLLYAIAVQPSLKRAVDASFGASAHRSALLVEGLSGIEEIKSLGAEGRFQHELEEAAAYMAKWGTRSRFMSSSVKHVSHYLQSIAVAMLVVGGVYMIGDGVLSQGGLIACIILSRRALSPMSQVANLATRVHRAKAALGSISRVMSLPVERPPGRVFLHRSRLEGAIELEDVTFAYPGMSAPVLRSVSIAIAPGERVGIIGPTGTGKSTLGRLMLGLYAPDEGTITIDGSDVAELDPADVRRWIGYVPQDVTLFQGSVRDNIVLGSSNVSDDDVLAAAEVAGVSSMIRRHTMGFDMPVGERGRNLSGGQRQGIAMARALVRDPSILILDEPTSSMDNRTETRLRKRLEGILPGKTLVLITHRTSLLMLVDRIVVVDRNRIVADGPRDEVVEALKTGQLVV